MSTPAFKARLAAERKNFRRSTITPEQVAKMRRLRDEGLTLAIIGQRFGCSYTTVSQALKREEK